MAGALVQSANFPSSVANERRNKLKGSAKPRRTVNAMCSLQACPPRIAAFSGWRWFNAVDNLGKIPGQDFHSQVAAATAVARPRRKNCRMVPRAMLELFTEKAIDVIKLAKDEARLLGHNFLGTEQILLALIGEGTGIAAKVLKSMGINLKDARVEVEKIIGRGSGIVAVEIPLTPRAKRVFEHSLEEARQLGHDNVGTEHLLLSLLREGEGAAGRVLENFGADPNDIRTQVIRMVGESAEAVGAGVGGGTSRTKMPTLQEYDSYFTKLAEEGKLDPVVGRADQIEQVTQILRRRTENNQSLIDQPLVLFSPSLLHLIILLCILIILNIFIYFIFNIK